MIYNSGYFRLQLICCNQFYKFIYGISNLQYPHSSKIGYINFKFISLGFR